MKVYTKKVGLCRYYVLMPIQRIGKAVWRVYRRIANRITHRWYCDGCKSYHGGRVVAYYFCVDCEGVCYKHITPEEVLECESIMLGSRNVRFEIQESIREEMADF